MKEKLLDDNDGVIATSDNGRWTNSIDLTITNAKGHDLVDRCEEIAKEMGVNCLDHNSITFSVPTKTGLRSYK